MYIVNALVRSVQLFKVFGKRTNHILTVMRNLKNGQAVSHNHSKCYFSAKSPPDQIINTERERETDKLCDSVPRYTYF